MGKFVNQFFEYSLLYVAASVVGLIIGAALLFVRGYRNILNNPTPERRTALISTVRKMAEDGQGYHQRLAYLQGQGLRKDVAAALLVEAERETSA